MKLGPYQHIKLDRRSAHVGWLIVVVGLIATTFSAFYVSRKNAEEDKIKFHYEKNLVLKFIDARIQRYEGALYQTRAYLLNSPGYTRQSLRNYIQDTEIFKRFPGLQGLGLSVIVPKEKLSEYKVWPEGERDVYTAVVVLEPENQRNKKALGYDMYSEDKRKKAMDLARLHKDVAMTEKITLVQEDQNKKLPGFNLYLPLLEPDTEKLLGWVYSPFRAGEFFKVIFQEANVHLDVEIFSGTTVSDDSLLYDSEKPLRLKSGVSETVDVNGEKLTILFSEGSTFIKSYSPMKTFITFLTGSLLTFFFWYVYLLTRKQMLIARIVADEKHKLFEREKAHVEARDDFLSIASHELKTPLTSLKLQAQVMKRAIQKNDPTALSTERVSNLANHIDNQTSRLTRLVDDMLDISRIRTGRLKMEKDFVDLNDMIKDVVDRLKEQFAKNNLNPPLIEGHEKVEGHWDRFRLEQVMTNLLTNAIRYGNGKPIKIVLEKDQKFARICVIDQGIGIAKENLDKIFERFERAGMSASEVSGLGLGLFITRQIVRAHKGDITVNSEPGRGATFIVQLPLEKQEDS